ncbi:hypothetical protein JHK85_053487 [Glycine max]|nr:hypothetical protein JHK86_052636 [Glycine max]KAG4927001.1 hypothetical protein JHK85_053487 [Glycine max]
MDDEQQLRHERDPYNKYGRSTWFLHTKRRTCCQLHSPWLTLKAINPIQDDIMVISVEITNCIVRTTLVDQGSSVDILFWNTFKRMGITEFKILPHDDPYLAVSEKGRPSLSVFGAIVSAPHLAMKFPSDTKAIIIVHVDQRLAKECYMASLKLGLLIKDERHQGVHYVEIVAEIEGLEGCNQVKYKAHLESLRLAKEVGGRRVNYQSDSKIASK